MCWPACVAEDIHLHASFQRLMEQTEVDVALEKRKEAPNRVPKLSRQDVIDVVRQVPPPQSHPLNHNTTVRTYARTHARTYVRM